jgi:nucleoside-diphosphate-sugar epimerase
MKVVLTGAGGFIGQNLIPLMTQAGCQVSAITSQLTRNKQIKGVEWFQCDLFHHKRMKELFDFIQPDILIHLAWEATPSKFWNSPNNFKWIDTTAYLLELFKKSGGNKVVISGTCAEYDCSYGYLTEDVTPTLPSTVYGESKNITRKYAQKFCLENKIDLVWARIFFPYGPGENKNKLIPIVIRALETGEHVKCSHGQQYRDYIHIYDVASALFHLAKTRNISGVFNIASGVPTKIETLIEHCLETFSNPKLPRFGALELPANDPMMIVGDIRKLQQSGWKPSIALVHGLRDYIDFLRK